MKKITLLLILVSFFYLSHFACSTFKLQKGDKLIYGHNLNEGDLGVPGMIFINKRGIFKIGRTLSELTTKERENPSNHHWISRYGSITFNNFGRDLPDGGVNEEGLFIWEMNEDAEYPKNESFPKLCQMNWMQYVLDNYISVDHVIKSANETEIDGWGWHFFVGDKNGNTAAIAFIDGKVVVNSGAEMPVPALFNTPYKRELKLLEYFNGHGGDYEVNMDDPNIPRFVKTSRLIDDYDYNMDENDYGFKMLDKIKVNDEPEWSIIYNHVDNKILYKTRISPEIKTINLNQVDFSNNIATQILNMDSNLVGDVSQLFEIYTNKKMGDFITSLFDILPEEFFTSGGITIDEYKTRFSSHTDAYTDIANEILLGSWNTSKEEKGPKFNITLNVKESTVSGTVSNGKDVYEIKHLSLKGDSLMFTFKTNGGRIVEMQCLVNTDSMDVSMFGIEETYGTFRFIRE